MKGKGRSRQAILAAVTVLAAAQAGTAYASTGPASESGVQTGAWIQEGQDWKYQGTDGTLKTGWVKTESGWYYLDPQTGRMMTGWITVDGQRYYMNTTADGVEGQMRRGWWKDNAGKWYFFSTASDGTEGMTVTGWQWIDGKCYYFEPSEGANHGKVGICAHSVLVALPGTVRLEIPASFPFTVGCRAVVPYIMGVCQSCLLYTSDAADE